MKNDDYYHADTLPNKEPIYLQLKNNACIQYKDLLNFEERIKQGLNLKVNLSVEEKDNILHLVCSEFYNFCVFALTVNDYKPADFRREIKNNDK